jgi:hypothetical protein
MGSLKPVDGKTLHLQYFLHEVIGNSLLPTTHADKQMIQFIHPVNAIKGCVLHACSSVL